MYLYPEIECECMAKRLQFPLILLIVLLSFALNVKAQLNLVLTADTNLVCDGEGCNYMGPTILINEVMTKPNSGDGSIYGQGPGMGQQAGEWIELYNPDICKPIDISCYFLGNNAPDDGGDWGGGFELPQGTVVPPRGFVVVRGINAPAVPAALLVQNGGRTIEVVVNTSPSVCVGGGFRLWFPNAGGWFAFYNAQGVAQDAISWNSTNNSQMNGTPCNPPGTCPFTGTLASYNNIPANRKTYIDNNDATQGQSYRRIPDGGAWVTNQQATATYGTCNATCIPAPVITCNGSATVTVTGGTPPYSYKWNDSQLQSTATATGLCGGTYCVTVTAAGGLSATACIDVPDYDPDVITGNLPDIICKNASPIQLTGGWPVGGTYSGVGVSNNVFDPLAAGSGPHTIFYSFFNNDSCGNTDSTSIEVIEATVVTFDTIPPVCAGTSAFQLTTGMPAGGIYSGAGVTGSNFDPQVSGPGTFQIKYRIIDPNGCRDSAVQNMVVYPLPNVQFPALPAQCISSDTLLLNSASPAGGTYSGPGVNAGIFNPATAGLGTHTITYTFTDNHSCTKSATSEITVNALPVVSTPALPSICASIVTVPLSGGLPAGGTYSGPGVSSNIFNSTTAGAGVHTLTYTYTDPAGCTDSAHTTIEVYPLPVLTFGALTPVCANAPPFVLNQATPPGGTYSGSGVSGGMYDPSVNGGGSFTITYTYTDIHNCTKSITQNIGVYPAAAVSLSLVDTLCEAVGPYPLTGGIPVGGTYLGTGITANILYPSVTDSGTFIIQYKYVNVNNCADSAFDTIYIADAPVVTFPDLPDICVNAEPVSLSGGLPAGGYYSGNGVTSGMFDPAVTGTGLQEVMYTYGIVSFCSGIDTAVIDVLELPDITMGSLTPVCEDADTLLLTGSLPLSGTYSGPGVSNGIFDPNLTGDGNFYLYYSYTDTNNCTNIDSTAMLVHPLPVSYLVTGGGIICDMLDGAHVGLDSSEVNVEYRLMLNGAAAGFPYTGTGFPLDFGVKTDSGTYTVYAVNFVTGCEDTLTGSVHISLITSPRVFLPDSGYFCDPSGFLLDGGSYLPDSVIYIWQDGSDQRYFTAKEPGTYWVKVGNQQCFGIDSILIKPCSELWLPNVFTPNSDGKNDRFYPVVTGDILSFKIEIYNRWGKMVYRSDDLQEGWDGTHFNNGSECSEGVYYYVVYYQGIGRGDPPPETKLSGSVTLFR